MRRALLVICLLASNAGLFGRDEPRANPSLSLEVLRAQLTAHISQDRFRGAAWGIKLVSLTSGATIFEHQSQKLLKPASNAKLFTGALALDVLGPDYRIRTSLYARNKPVSGILAGDLIIYGRGDPTFAGAFESEPARSGLGRIIEAVRAAGLRRIEGDLVGDATYFTGPAFGSGWNWDDLQYYYGAEASALCVEDNVMDLAIRPARRPDAPCVITSQLPISPVELVNRTLTGAAKTRAVISIERPPGQNRAFITGTLPKDYGTWSDAVSISGAPLWFATLLKEELARAGIVVTGRPRALSPPENSRSDLSGLIEIASLPSPPISAVVRKMMKVSQNLYAQLLLLQVGANSQDASGQATTEELGVKQLGEFIRRAGLRPADVLLDDGAGLSRACLVTPDALVQLLRYMAKHQAAAEFQASLPEAGTDGTLRTRFKELGGKLRAKTGTIRYVNTLSGYMTTTAGDDLAFAIMLNAYDPPSGSNSRDDLDVIPRLAMRLEPSASR